MEAEAETFRGTPLSHITPQCTAYCNWSVISSYDVDCFKSVCVYTCIYIDMYTCIYMHKYICPIYTQPVAFGVLFHRDLQSPSQRSLLNGTWQKRRLLNRTWQKRSRELDDRQRSEIQEMTPNAIGCTNSDPSCWIESSLFQYVYHRLVTDF